MQGSVTVIVELMKFDKNGVISARNRITEATPLQLAAEGGHAQVVKVLVRAGASCSDENKVFVTCKTQFIQSTNSDMGLFFFFCLFFRFVHT
jgi:ankyrin repeat protein